VDGVTFIVALFACVLLHEFGHALMARVFGIPTPDITLLPIGGVARLQRMPDQPLQEILVALAGPAVNVVIAIILFVVLDQRGDLSQIEKFASPEVGLLPKLAVVNVWLVLFNMLPAFPMDGGAGCCGRCWPCSRPTRRPRRSPPASARAWPSCSDWRVCSATRCSYSSPLFVYLAAAQEASFAQIKEAAQGLLVRDAMMTRLTVIDASATLEDAIEALLRTGQHDFPVVDEQGVVVGILTRDDLIAGYRTQGITTPVVEVMHRDVPTIRADAPLEQAMRQMQECSCPGLAVVDRLGRVVGLVSPESVGELLMLQAILPRGTAIAWHRDSARSSLPSA
jgi:CBS domain-containing protein